MKRNVVIPINLISPSRGNKAMHKKIKNEKPTTANYITLTERIK